jgi:hypothetical protein
MDSIAMYRELIASRSDVHSATMGWLSDQDYRKFGEQALANDVIKPLRERGIMVE